MSTDPGMASWTYRPTAVGAMTSSCVWMMRVGTVTSGRSRRLSERNVTWAKCRAISGSVAQKLSVSSAPSSARSGLPMMMGAIPWAHPVKFASSESRSPSIASCVNPPVYPGASV